MTSEPSVGRISKRRRRLWPVVVGLSVLVIALAVFAWPGGDGDGVGPLNAVAKAAEKTRSEPGGRAAMHATLTSPTGSEIPMTGRIVFDDEADRSRGVVTFPNPHADGLVTLEAVTDGSAMYMRSNTFGSLPGGREWMGLDLPTAEGSESPLPAGSDAQGELTILEGIGDVRKLGQEDVRGVATTRYRGTIGASDEENEPLTVEVWIDADERVRRMRMVSSQPGKGGEGPTTSDMRMDFFDFGPVPAIEVPDSSEVFDATNLAKEGIDPADS